MDNFAKLSDKLSQAVLLVRCGDLDIQTDERLVDDPGLLNLLSDISHEVNEMPEPDLAGWPSRQDHGKSIFWLKGNAIIAEFLVKRPRYKNQMPLPKMNVDAVFTSIESLVDDPALQHQERLNDKIRFLRATIRCLLFRVGEVYRFNDNSQTELEQVIFNLDRLSEFANKVLEIDRTHSNYSLKAEIYYYKGRAERARGYYHTASESFTECLKLARKRIERYEGDPGDADLTTEYRHSSYLAARTLLQLAFLEYLKGSLPDSRKLITASWFIIHQCHDRSTKAEIQFTTAAVRRALTTDQSKLRIIESVLKEADETLGELGHFQIQQMAKSELVLCCVYQNDFERARAICSEMSRLAQQEMANLARVKAYWEARAKKLLAINNIHEYESTKNSRPELIDEAINFSGAATRNLQQNLPHFRNEIVVALCVQAQAYIARLAKKRETNNQNEQKVTDTKKADELLREAERRNRFIESPPKFGEMSSLHNQAVISLLRCQLSLESGDVSSAQNSLMNWETDLREKVETRWLHDLAEKLKERIPQQRKTMELNPNQNFDDSLKDLAKGLYDLVKHQLSQSGQKVTNSEIADRIGISEATLRRYGVIKSERLYRKKKSK